MYVLRVVDLVRVRCMEMRVLATICDRGAQRDYGRGAEYCYFGAGRCRCRKLLPKPVASKEATRADPACAKAEASRVEGSNSRRPFVAVVVPAKH